MSKLACQLIAHSLSPHIQQIYTGFTLLHRRGLIELTQVTARVPRRDPNRPEHLIDARHAHLRAIVGGATRVHYDTHDSWEIDEEFLAASDVYFKRSYAPDRLERLGELARRVRPLGLNYHVFPPGLDPFAVHRSTALGSLKEKLLTLAQSSASFDLLRFVPRLRHLEALPDIDVSPRVLFMAGAWDPEGLRGGAREKIEERRHINDTRAACIRRLRATFGRAFHGGFIRSPFALAAYPHEVLPDSIQSSKRHYLEWVRTFPICVATTGLHGSIGWKFAEYIALSRAIASEPLNYVVPGGLEDGTHYFAFTSPETCVKQVQRLVEDHDLRKRMMIANARYYESWVRPDALVLNTVLTALNPTR